jgi:hypothetical protein
LGLFDNAVDARITKLISKYTGQYIQPSFHAPCHSSISTDWDGWVAIDSDSIWLVNNLDARGAQIANLTLDDALSGQYPVGTRGYPKYAFHFNFISGGSFSVYPKTVAGGEEMTFILARKFSTNKSKNGTLDKMNSEEAMLQAFTSIESSPRPRDVNPEFRTCPMCAEDIKFAAKKCRYCQHMMDV